MCTLTWFDEPGGYQLFINRDERLTRAPAQSPAVLTAAGVRLLAPLDGEFGGTWIAVNEFGLSVALINGYTETEQALERPPGSYASRGLLPLALADSPTADVALRRLQGLSIDELRSFDLLAVDPHGAARLARWSGSSLTVYPNAQQHAPLVSSSFEPHSVVRSRRELYARREPGEERDCAEIHLAYHASHEPERGPYSVCMHRADARTVSFSWLQVDGERIRFHYAPDSPCRGRAGADPLTLTRCRE